MKNLLILLVCTFGTCHSNVHAAQNTEAQQKSMEGKYLVVLDIQQLFCQNRLDSLTADTLIRNINQLIQQTDPDKVVYVKSIIRVLTVGKGGFHADTVGNLEFDERLTICNDQIFCKTHSNAFEEEDLKAFFTNSGTTDIVVVGLLAEHCVKNTLIGGQKEGYHMYTIEKMVAGKNYDSLHKQIVRLSRKGIETLVH